jgi:hypothetical protein
MPSRGLPQLLRLLLHLLDISRRGSVSVEAWGKCVDAGSKPKKLWKVALRELENEIYVWKFTVIASLCNIEREEESEYVMYNCVETNGRAEGDTAISEWRWCVHDAIMSIP